MERKLERTTVYLVRHAQPNYRNHDDRSRELTAKGMPWAVKLTFAGKTCLKMESCEL